MSEEIKEILEEFEILFEISEAPEHIIKDFNKIKDYITNLQTIEQQYSAILSENAELENKITILQERIDKANEYLNKVRTFAMVDKVNILSISTLENILKGNDNND